MIQDWHFGFGSLVEDEIDEGSLGNRLQNRQPPFHVLILRDVGPLSGILSFLPAVSQLQLRVVSRCFNMNVRLSLGSRQLSLDEVISINLLANEWLCGKYHLELRSQVKSVRRIVENLSSVSSVGGEPISTTLESLPSSTARGTVGMGYVGDQKTHQRRNRGRRSRKKKSSRKMNLSEAVAWASSLKSPSKQRKKKKILEQRKPAWKAVPVKRKRIVTRVVCVSESRSIREDSDIRVRFITIRLWDEWMRQNASKIAQFGRMKLKGQQHHQTRRVQRAEKQLHRAMRESREKLLSTVDPDLSPFYFLISACELIVSSAMINELESMLLFLPPSLLIDDVSAIVFEWAQLRQIVDQIGVFAVDLRSVPEDVSFLHIEDLVLVDRFDPFRAKVVLQTDVVDPINVTEKGFVQEQPFFLSRGTTAQLLCAISRKKALRCLRWMRYSAHLLLGNPSVYERFSGQKDFLPSLLMLTGTVRQRLIVKRCIVSSRGALLPILSFFHEYSPRLLMQLDSKGNSVFHWIASVSKTSPPYCDLIPALQSLVRWGYIHLLVDVDEDLLSDQQPDWNAHCHRILALFVGYCAEFGVKLLLAGQAVPKARLDVPVLVDDPLGRTNMRSCYSALHIASASGAVGIVRILLAAGANANVVSVNGSTPIHFAAKAGHQTVVAALLSAGARISNRFRRKYRILLAEYERRVFG